MSIVFSPCHQQITGDNAMEGKIMIQRCSRWPSMTLSVPLRKSLCKSWHNKPQCCCMAMPQTSHQTKSLDWDHKWITNDTAPYPYDLITKDGKGKLLKRKSCWKRKGKNKEDPEKNGGAGKLLAKPEERDWESNQHQTNKELSRWKNVCF